MTNSKDPKDDIIEAGTDGPEPISDAALDNVDGGITLDNGLKNRIRSIGPLADTIYAGSPTDALIGGAVADTIYGGAHDDLIGGFSKLKR